LGIHYRARLKWWTYMGAIGLLALAGVSVLSWRQTPVAALRQEVRLPVWRSTIEIIRDRLWSGVGLDGFQFVYPRYMQIDAWTEPVLQHPHNMWLDAAVRLGLPGVALFAGLTACCVYEARRLLVSCSSGFPLPACLKQRWLCETVAVGCLSGLLAGLAHGMVDSGYFLVDLAWVFGLMGGMVTVRPLHAHLTRRRNVAGGMDA
jgi:O-antigen ligase